MQAIQTPVPAERARQTINTAGREHTLVIYYRKKDGTTRRMVCRYFGEASRVPSQMTVWDLEKGARRTVNLDTVEVLKVLGVSRPRRTFDDLAALFG